VHAVLVPSAVTYLPAAQFEHAEDPMLEYVASGHEVQVVEVPAAPA